MMNKEVTNYIESAPEEHKAIMTKIRALLFSVVPDAEEEFKWSRPVYSHKKDFAYLVANKNHVNFGFSQFEKIKNPTDKLEGTGKTMRHVKLKTVADIDEQLFQEWIHDMIKE
jgi:hypothetical protein